MARVAKNCDATLRDLFIHTVLEFLSKRKKKVDGREGTGAATANFRVEERQSVDFRRLW